MGENTAPEVTWVLSGLSHSVRASRTGTRSDYILWPHCSALGLVQRRPQTMFVE